MLIYKLTDAGPLQVVSEDGIYERMSRNYCSIEVSFRTGIIRGNKYHCSVAGYNPDGNSIRVWGTKLLNGAIPTLWKEYTRLSSTIGKPLTKRQISMMLDILRKHKEKRIRLVVFYK